MADTVLELLIKLVEKKGPEYPERNPWEVYRYLTEQKADDVQARLVLVTLTAGAVQKAQKLDQDGLSRALQTSCRMTKSAADEMAELYQRMYSPAQTAAWDAKRSGGFRELCESIWEFEWSGEAVWTCGGGHRDCSAELRAELEVEGPPALEKFLSGALLKNPFLSWEELADIIEEDLRASLDGELEEYVDSDHYYEPVMEDFESESYLEDACRKLGLRIVPDSCESSGELGEYEPEDFW